MDSESPGGLGSLRWSNSGSESTDDETVSPEKLHQRLVNTADVVSVVARERDVLTEALTQHEEESEYLKQLLADRNDRIQRLEAILDEMEDDEKRRKKKDKKERERLEKEVDEGGRAQAAVSELQKELEATRAARDAAQKRADAAERARELARAELAAKLSLAESEAASKFEAASRVVRARFETRAAELGLEVDSWKSFVAANGVGAALPGSSGLALLENGEDGEAAGKRAEALAAAVETFVKALHPKVPVSPDDSAALLGGGGDPEGIKAAAANVAGSLAAALAAAGKAGQAAQQLRGKLAEARGAVRDAETRAVAATSAAAAKVAAWGDDAQAQLDGAYARADHAEARVKELEEELRRAREEGGRAAAAAAAAGRPPAPQGPGLSPPEPPPVSPRVYLPTTRGSEWPPVLAGSAQGQGASSSPGGGGGPGPAAPGSGRIGERAGAMPTIRESRGAASAGGVPPGVASALERAERGLGGSPSGLPPRPSPRPGGGSGSGPDLSALLQRAGASRAGARVSDAGGGASGAATPRQSQLGTAASMPVGGMAAARPSAGGTTAASAKLGDILARAARSSQSGAGGAQSRGVAAY